MVVEQPTMVVEQLAVVVEQPMVATVLPAVTQVDMPATHSTPPPVEQVRAALMGEAALVAHVAFVAQPVATSPLEAKASGARGAIVMRAR